MYKALYPILFRDNWPARGLEHAIASIDPDALAAEYKALRKNAPRRREVGKAYFVEHSGAPSSGSSSNRLEEHYAMALWNLSCRLPRRSGGWHRFLDYQAPLKARRADSGIGKVDLLGITDRGRLIVVELKYPRSGRGDSPARALMEGLRYAAIVEANLQPIAIEVKRKLGVKRVDDRTPPIAQVLGPGAWWRGWLDPGLKNRAAGDWNRAFARLASALEARIGVTVECMATDDNAKLTLGLNGQAPALDCPPDLYHIHLDRNPPECEALPPVDRHA